MVFGREKKKRRKQLGKRKISEKCFLPVWGVPRAIYSPKHEIEVAVIVRLPAAFQWPLASILL